MAETSTLCNGLPAIELRAPDGARAVVTLHGGHVTSWVPAGSTQDQLYLSPASAFADGKAIRGGVPVIFPQFSDRGPLVRHGFARTRPWMLLDAGVDGQDALARLRLTDDQATRGLWPHAFALDLTVRVSGSGLVMELACRNTGGAPFAFSCALHTYLRVRDVASVQLLGLAGLPYRDAVDGSSGRQPEVELEVRGELDRVYHGVADPLRLVDAPAQRSLRVAQRGFEDVVVWNPGEARAASLADLAHGEWRQMLCIEAARIAHPVRLNAGQRWSGVQQLTVTG